MLRRRKRILVLNQSNTVFSNAGDLLRTLRRHALARHRWKVLVLFSANDADRPDFDLVVPSDASLENEKENREALAIGEILKATRERRADRFGINKQSSERKTD